MSLSPAYQIRLRLASGRVTVETTGAVRETTLPDGATAWIGGTVDAIRTRAGSWQPAVPGAVLPIDPTRPEASLADLEGQFVIVVERRGRYVIGTDPQGRADVFVSSEGDLIATDLSLMDRPAARGYDQAAWAHALTVYGHRPPKAHTPYAGIRRLAVGETLAIDQGAVTCTKRPFTPSASRPLTTRSLDEYADRFLDALAIRGSRWGNVVYLSSGWDSTAILAGLVHLFGPGKVRAVTGRMRYADRSGVINQFEIDRATAIAAYYGIPLTIAEFDYRRDAGGLLEKVSALFRGRNLSGWTGINHYVLARTVAETSGGDETVFAGEISDGAHNLGFSQFTTIFHPTQAFREYSDKMAGYLFGPTFLRQLHAGVADQDAVYQMLRSRIGAVSVDAPADSEAGRTRQLLASLFLRGSRFPLASLTNARMLTPAGASMYAAAMEGAYLSDAAEQATPETLYAWYLHLYNSFHWQGATVAPLAITGEALGLRMALPFWDSRLQESLASLPEDAGRGLDLHPTKYPLKWTLQHRLDYPFHLQVGPHSYLYDVDPSFSHSAELAYGSSCFPLFQDALRSYPHREVLDPAFFDMPYVDGVVARYLAGEEVRGAALSDLMALAMTASFGWYRD